MSIHDELVQLLGQLVEATRANRLQWEETAQPGTFRAPFQGGAVLVVLSGAKLGAKHRHRASILNPAGTVIETFNPANDSEEALLRILHEEARASALRPQAVLENIKKELAEKLRP